jgi:hypothetical protein
MRESIKRNRDLLLRLLAALAVGLAIASTAYLCAFYELRWSFWHASLEGYAWSKVRLAAREIEEYRKEKGRLPANLEELRKGGWNDVWDRPLHYEVEGDSYKLYSYGRDGVPGGEGPDADIFADRPPEAPTIYQFTSEMPSEGVQCSCILAGVCTGLVCLLQSRKQGRAVFFGRLIVTAIGAVLAAIAISIVHIPSGH